MATESNSKTSLHPASTSKMRHSETLHQKVGNTEKALAEDEALENAQTRSLSAQYSRYYPDISCINIHWIKRNVTHRGGYNQRRILSPHDAPPPPAQHATNRPRQRKRRDVVHAWVVRNHMLAYTTQPPSLLQDKQWKKKELTYQQQQPDHQGCKPATLHHAAPPS